MVEQPGSDGALALAAGLPPWLSRGLADLFPAATAPEAAADPDQTLAARLAEAEALDAGMKLGCNQPIGPLALADMIGLDVCLAVMEVYLKEFGDSKYRPSPLLKEMVAAGRLGRKTGQGVYKY
jgi:hypothetical protein